VVVVISLSPSFLPKPALTGAAWLKDGKRGAAIKET